MTVAGSRRAGPPNQCRVEIMVRDFVSRMLIATVYQDAEKGWNGSFRGGGVAHEPGIHMWTAPGPQEAQQRADRIACDHMSGLLSRSHMTAAKMGFAT